MTSTYSPNLKIELITTGEQSGTWGSTTNTNLGTLIEQAIVGYSTQTVTDSTSPTTLTISNGASSTGRNYVIELLGTLTAARTVEVPAVQKTYTFYNNTVGGFAVTVKVTGMTGVSIAAGKKAILYVNGTDAIEVVNAPLTESGTQTLTNKTISGASNTITNVSLTTAVTGTLPTANGGTNLTAFTSGGAVYATSTSVLTTGTLPVTAGGSGVATITGIIKGTGTTAFTAATAGTDYVAPGTATTFTAAQTFSNNGIVLLGSSTGGLTFSSANTGATNYTLTFPAASGTVLLSTTIGSSIPGSSIYSANNFGGL
jgi:hypothetical protein